MNRGQQIVVWVLMSVVALVSVNVGVELYTVFSRKPDPLAEAAVQLAVTGSLDRAVQQAKQLSSEGKHLEGGYF